MPPPSGNQRRRARGGRNRHGGGDVVASRPIPGSGADASTATSTAATSPSSADASASGAATAIDLFKDAQAATAELKTLLQSQPPWSRDADAVRQRARNTYLAILFQHPLSPHAQTLDSLWLGTTYTLISAYRDVVGRIEAALPPRRKEGGGKDSNGSSTAADLRRTLARFRQALVAEDTFYRSLIGRIVAFYRLQDRAADHLALVGVPVPAPAADNDPSIAPPLSREEMEKKVGLVYKGLICLGDLERYKEQYSEKARRDTRDGMGPRDAKFDRAVMYYEVGRGLQPDNGMAFNQLAVIDGYLGDNFHCTYHYFRALAVRQPFPGGEANLERVLKRAFDRWRVSRHEGTRSGPDSPPDDLDVFRRDLLVICAILFLKASTSYIPTMRDSLCEQLTRNLRARKLPSETIVKTTAMAIGSHWYCRLEAGRNGAPANNEAEASKAKRRRMVEDLSLTFLFAVYTALVTVTAVEVEEALASRVGEDESAVAEEEEDGDVDTVLALAQRITAVVRRILPSLRIMSRWLKSHLDYVSRASRGSNTELRALIANFWAQYKRLMLALARLFPLVQLPSLDGPLEEDIDMRGFLPLRRGLSEETPTDPQRQDVHPNEEQLMRIADLLVDVKLLWQTEAGAAVLNDGAFPTAPFVAPNSEAVSVSVSTETEDDPVNAAMRAGLEPAETADEAEEDEELIMWERSTPVVEQTARLSVGGGQTAQDLLQNLSLGAQQVQHGPLPAPMLFGGDAGGSIWTMSREESQKGAQRAALVPVPWQTKDQAAAPWPTEQQPQPQGAPHVSNPSIYDYSHSQAPQAHRQASLPESLHQQPSLSHQQQQSLSQSALGQQHLAQPQHQQQPQRTASQGSAPPGFGQHQQQQQTSVPPGFGPQQQQSSSHPPPSFGQQQQQQQPAQSGYAQQAPQQPGYPGYAPFAGSGHYSAPPSHPSSAWQSPAPSNNQARDQTWGAPRAVSQTNANIWAPPEGASIWSGGVGGAPGGGGSRRDSAQWAYRPTG